MARIKDVRYQDALTEEGHKEAQQSLQLLVGKHLVSASVDLNGILTLEFEEEHSLLAVAEQFAVLFPMKPVIQ